jgi:hypothetical protein
MRRLKQPIALGIAAALACDAAARAQERDTPVRKNYMQTVAEQREAGVEGSQTRTIPVVDHGGTVLPLSKTYAIYWGPTSGFASDLHSGMVSLLSGFNGSSYLGIAQQYMRGASVSTAYMGSAADTSAPPARAPSTAAIAAEVCKLYPHPDPSALYIVFTSNAPKVNYCAWHARATCKGVTIQVAYVPNQALLSGCSPYVVKNLGCNKLSDGTVASADSVAHEFMESITDPQLDAWYDKKGAEIADKCNFVYQSCVNLATGSWQIQSEWSNALKGCQQH